MFLQIVRETVRQKIDSPRTTPRALSCGSSAFIRQQKITQHTLSSNQNKIHQQPVFLGPLYCWFLGHFCDHCSVTIPSRIYCRFFPLLCSSLLPAVVRMGVLTPPARGASAPLRHPPGRDTAGSPAAMLCRALGTLSLPRDGAGRCGTLVFTTTICCLRCRSQTLPESLKHTAVVRWNENSCKKLRRIWALGKNDVGFSSVREVSHHSRVCDVCWWAAKHEAAPSATKSYLKVNKTNTLVTE